MSLWAPGDAPSAGNDNEVSELSELQARKRSLTGVSEVREGLCTKTDAGGSGEKPEPGLPSQKPLRLQTTARSRSPRPLLGTFRSGPAPVESQILAGFLGGMLMIIMLRGSTFEPLLVPC